MNYRRPSRLICLAAFVASAISGQTPVGARQLQQEDDLRAALVLGFARFTEWPGTRDGPLVIGVIGRPGIAAALERLSQGKPVNGRSVVVRQLRQPAQPAGCHIVYFGRLPGARLAEVLGEVRGEVLTIGEDDRLLNAGGAVQLFEEDGRISFEVRLPALHAANLTISSKLLRLGYTSGAGRRAKGTP